MGRVLKRLFGVVIVCGVAAAIMYFTSSPLVQKQAGGGRRGGKTGAGEVVPVVAATVQRKDVPIHLEGVGSAKARNSVTVKPQVDGKILSIDFREGQDVKKGDVIARIDPVTYQAQLDQALAKKAVDEALLGNAKLDLERYNKVGPNVVTQKLIDTQRALVIQYTAQISQDEAAVASARAVLGYTNIVAPFDGRTGIRMVDQGNLVKSGDTGIVTITEVRPIAVLFTLPQQELGQINAALAKGPVTVEATDSDAGKVVDTGMLQVVDNQVDASTGTVRLKAEFPNARLQLWPGQFVNVRVLVDTLRQVVVVPSPAVQRGPNGTYVFAVADGKAVMKPVAVVRQAEQEMVLASGVEAGEKVIVNGFVRLRDGASVSTDAEEPGAATGQERTSDSGGVDGGGSKQQRSGATTTAAEAVVTTPAEAGEQQQPAERRRGEGKRGEGRRKRDGSTSP